MPIKFPEPPEDVAAAAEELAGEEPTTFYRLANDLGGVTPLAPQPIFTAGLESIVENKGDVERVVDTPTSWRVSSELGGGGQVLEFVAESLASEAQALRVGDDRFTPAIAKALKEAEHDPRVVAGDFEGRLLRVPALKLLALWLHSVGAEDLFVPIGPTTVDAAPGRVQEAGAFQTRLREAASETLNLYEKADRPDELGG